MRLQSISLFFILTLLLFSVCKKPAAVVPPAPPQAVKTGSLVVLIPDEQGRTGSILVTSRGGAQPLDQPNTAVEIPTADSAPSSPEVWTTEEIQKTFGTALQALPQAAAVYVLYFKLSTTSLTEESAALLPEVIKTVKQRMPCLIRVVGHTDTVGSDEVNEKLARQRAEAVREKLVEIGMDPSLIEAVSYGKRDLLIPTGDNVNEPRNRRVEIAIR